MVKVNLRESYVKEVSAILSEFRTFSSKRFDSALTGLIEAKKFFVEEKLTEETLFARAVILSVEFSYKVDNGLTDINSILKKHELLANEVFGMIQVLGIEGLRNREGKNLQDVFEVILLDRIRMFSYIKARSEILKFRNFISENGFSLQKADKDLLWLYFVSFRLGEKVLRKRLQERYGNLKK